MMPNVLPIVQLSTSPLTGKRSNRSNMTDVKGGANLRWAGAICSMIGYIQVISKSLHFWHHPHSFFNFIPCNIQNRYLTRAAITSSTSCRLCQCTSAMMSILRGWKCSNNNCCTFLGVSEFWCEIIIPAMQWSSRLTASKQQSLPLIKCGVHSYCTSTMDDFSVTFNNSGVMFERLLPLKEHNHRMERMWA